MSEVESETVGARTSRTRSDALFTLGLAGLLTVGLAQPVLDLVGVTPEFLVAHQMGLLELGLFVAAVAVGLPMVLACAVWLLARVIGTLVGRFTTASASDRAVAEDSRTENSGIENSSSEGFAAEGTEAFGNRLEDTVRGFFVGFAGLLISLRILNALGAGGLWPAAVVGGLGVGFLFFRSSSARSVLHYLAFALIAIPVLFLARPGVRAATGTLDEADYLQSSGATAPVIFVVFDEWAFTSILGADRELDAARLPNLARFASTATWYPNAVAASDSTTYAVPAILSGRYPDGAPTSAAYPQSLFSMLGASHTVFSDEPVTLLCPPSLNQVGGVTPIERVREAVLDAAVVWGHLVLPGRFAGQLPPIDDRWQGFRETAAVVEDGEVFASLDLKARKAIRTDRASRFRAFVGRIEATEEPVVHFLHTLLPHRPSEYDADGTRYGPVQAFGLADGRWKDDPLLSSQVYERYELQVEFVDRLIGELMERLEEVGLFEQAAIVLVADHGVSFEAGSSRRRVTDDNVHEIAPVPLFIKLPGQSAGAVDESFVTTVDVLPTLADALGVNLQGSEVSAAWAMDGASLVRRAGKSSGPDGVAPVDAADSQIESGPANPTPAASVEQDPLRFVSRNPPTVSLADVHRRKYKALERRMALVPDGGSGVVAGPRLELVGKQIASLPVIDSRRFSVALDGVRGEPGELESVVSRYISGVVTGDDESESLDLAVAVGGRVVRTVRADRLTNGTLGFGVLLASLPEGLSEAPTSVYEIRQREDSLVLVRPFDELLDIRLTLDSEGELAGVSTSRQTFEPGRFRGGLLGLTREADAIVVQGWAVDPRRGSGADGAVIFFGDQVIATMSASGERAWVAENLGEEYRFSGFVARVPLTRLPGLEQKGVRVVAYSGDRAGEIEAAPVGYDVTTRQLYLANGRVLRVESGTQDGLGGAVDWVNSKASETAVFGWALDELKEQRVRLIAVFDRGDYLTQFQTDKNRELPAFAGRATSGPSRVGFIHRLSGSQSRRVVDGEVRFVAIAQDWRAFELPVKLADSSGK